MVVEPLLKLGLGPKLCGKGFTLPPAVRRLGGGENTMKSRLTDLARSLRRRSTDAERTLWRSLRARQLGGLRFRRQHPIGDYIVDFVCLERALVIELDGGQHSEPMQKTRDVARDRWLEEEGFMVLRFWDNEVLTNVEGVLEVIESRCLDRRCLRERKGVEVPSRSHVR